MTQLAKDTGLGRESLYKALSGEGNPSFATILKVTRALGLRLHGGLGCGVWGIDYCPLAGGCPAASYFFLCGCIDRRHR